MLWPWLTQIRSQPNRPAAQPHQRMLNSNLQQHSLPCSPAPMQHPTQLNPHLQLRQPLQLLKQLLQSSSKLGRLQRLPPLKQHSPRLLQVLRLRGRTDQHLCSQNPILIMLQTHPAASRHHKSPTLVQRPELPLGLRPSLLLPVGCGMG